MAGASMLTGNVVRLAVGAAAVGYALAALTVARGPGRYTTYAGQSEILASLAVLPGLALIAAGVTTAVTRPVAARLGDLATLAGFVWFAPFWVGWEGGPALVRSLGMVAAGFVVPLLVHVTLAYPDGRLSPAPARGLVSLAYLVAGLAAAGRAVFYDPFADPHCWMNCTANVFVVQSLPGVTETISRVDLGFSAVLTIAVVAVQVGRLGTATRAVRRTLWAAVPGGAVLSAATVGRLMVLADNPIENPDDPAFQLLFVVLSSAALLVAAALGWASVRAGTQRRALAQVITDLDQAPRPGALQPALARAVGDAELTIAYVLPGEDRFADAQGSQIDRPVATTTRSVTPLVRSGRPVAVIAHAVSATTLLRELSPAIRLALENEVLQVQLLAQVEDLRSSRARIVAAGDARRRRLERDLHDGAQQHLVALTYGLRLADASALGDGTADVASLLSAATADAHAALEELRELASGIFPVLLAEGGLAPAIAALAEAASFPVEIGECSQGRYSESVESAGYLVVAAAVEQATHVGASYAAVTVIAAKDRLVITVQDDGPDRGAPLVDLLDRVGALGGTVHRRDDVLRAEIPCG